MEQFLTGATHLTSNSTSMSHSSDYVSSYVEESGSMLDDFLNYNTDFLLKDFTNIEDFFNYDDPSSVFDLIDQQITDYKLQCAEVQMNINGCLTYECKLCKSQNKKLEFVNLTAFQNHLKEHHSGIAQQSAHLTPDDLGIFEELQKIEKNNFLAHSTEFMEQIDKVKCLIEN